MERDVIVDEEVDALVRLMPGGELRPTSFLWRGRTRYVSHHGRIWEERVNGHTVRCYLIEDVAENRYELRWHPAADRWILHRAWLQGAVV